MVRRAGKKKRFGRREALPGVGLCLDGGFGVGKTHLLASLVLYRLPSAEGVRNVWRIVQLASVFGFVECIELLADYVVVCIDEFELDDPGNTTLISRLLSQLVERGVSVAATSNTLPRAAGRGPLRRSGFSARNPHARFDFHDRPESGPGSRHRDLPPAPGAAERRGGCCARRRFSRVRRSTSSTRCVRTWRPCIRRAT